MLDDSDDICDASVLAWEGCNQTVAEMCPTSLTATCTAVGKRIPGFECYTSPPSPSPVHSAPTTP